MSTGSRPYALARSAAGCSTAVTSWIDVYSMYRLFSQTNTTGSFQITAKFSASWNAPMFVVPSPKKHTATCSVPRYCADQAAPFAIVRCAPMIAYEPSMLCFTLVKCIEPPLPRMRPDELPMSSPKICRHRHAADQRVVVAAIGAERVVLRAHRRAEARGDGLLAERQVARALDEVLHEQVVGALLEHAALLHRAVKLQPRFGADGALRAPAAAPGSSLVHPLRFRLLTEFWSIGGGVA